MPKGKTANSQTLKEMKKSESGNIQHSTFNLERRRKGAARKPFLCGEIKVEHKAGQG
jgi:hypothetical protein